MIDAYGDQTADAERRNRLRLIALGVLVLPLQPLWAGGFLNPVDSTLGLFIDGAIPVMVIAAAFALVAWREHRLAPGPATSRELKVTLTVLKVLGAQTALAFPFRPRF